METEQFNIRMPKELVQDLDVISRLLKVNKSEWVKTKLAEEVHEEKKKLLMELGASFASGFISRQELEKAVGKQVADEMDFIRKKAKESVQKGLQYGKGLKAKVRI